jgi:hypothetical protein
MPVARIWLGLLLAGLSPSAASAQPAAPLTEASPNGAILVTIAAGDRLTYADRLTIHLAPGGGFAARLRGR